MAEITKTKTKRKTVQKSINPQLADEDIITAIDNLPSARVDSVGSLSGNEIQILPETTLDIPTNVCSNSCDSPAQVGKKVGSLLGSDIQIASEGLQDASTNVCENTFVSPEKVKISDHVEKDNSTGPIQNIDNDTALASKFEESTALHESECSFKPDEENEDEESKEPRTEQEETVNNIKHNEEHEDEKCTAGSKVTEESCKEISGECSREEFDKTESQVAAENVVAAVEDKGKSGETAFIGLQADHHVLPKDETSVPNAPVEDASSHLYPSLGHMAAIADTNIPGLRQAAEPSSFAADAIHTQANEWSLIPFTGAQLASLYHNPKLQSNPEFVEAFLETIDQSKHEFYEIILNYHRARNQLSNAEKDVQALQNEADVNRNLVWEHQQKNLVLQGQCADRAKVSTDYTYTRAEFHEEGCQMLENNLKDIRSVLHERFALSSYQVQFSRLHVEAYIHKLYRSKPDLAHILTNSPVTVKEERDINLYNQLVPFKTCINVLFLFLRKPSKCPVFIQDIKKWITKLLSTLLRVADHEDHLYILNHVLRCPAGVGAWGAACVQVLEPPAVEPGARSEGVFTHPLLNHYVSMLAMLLVPVKFREEVLSQWKITNSPMPNAMENPWILVDSEGEEDEDPENSWHMLQENDLVSFLNQMPLSVAFRHVLGIRTSRDGGTVYSTGHLATESATLKLFAFATTINGILEQGLRTYSMSRYRQLNKRLARYIRHTVCYVADHLQRTNMAQQNARVQTEFDSFFSKAVNILLSANKFGAWQFLADLPYEQVSLGSMWRLLWRMHVPDENQESFSVDVADIQKQLAGADSLQAFEDRLVNMATSEALHLLNTFANMARSHKPNELHFITLIALEIYEIAYLSAHTREFCSRQGRELLDSVLARHPPIFSALLAKTAESLDRVGRVAVFLYKGLPVDLWKPTNKDLTILQSWLVEHSLDSVESELARVILEKLNWDFDPNVEGMPGKLWLDLSTHRYFATVFMSAYSKHLKGRHFSNTYTIRQMGPWLRSAESEEDKMATWLWQRSLRLHLHACAQVRLTQTPGNSVRGPAVAPSAMAVSDMGSSQPPGSIPSTSVASAPVASAPGSENDISAVLQNLSQGFRLVDVTCDDRFKVIQEGLGKNFTLANFFVLALTKHGHNLADFCQEGLNHLAKLVEYGYHLPAIHSVSTIVPLLFYSTEYLFTNKRFKKIIEQILYMDTSKGGMFYSEFPGPITIHFSGMIQHHIFHGIDGKDGRKVISFWLRFLTSLEKWHMDRNVLYVLDNLVKASTQLDGGAFDETLEFFYSVQKEFKAESDAGVLSSLSSWLAPLAGGGQAGSPPGSLIADTRSWSGLSWLAYAVLSAEERIEQESGVWIELQKALRQNDDPGASGRVSLDHAMKVIQHKHKRLTQGCLMIYRWAQQAVATEPQDPVLPLLWQRFFLLYLGRPVLVGSLRERESMGDKFFESGALLSMMKTMKQKLREGANHFDTASKDLQAEMTSLIREADDSASSLNMDMKCGDLQAKLSAANESRRLYESLCFWLDEPLLHSATLYLPSLPAEYATERLLTVVQSSRSPWNHLVRWQEVFDDLVKLRSQWDSLISPTVPSSPAGQRQHETSPDNSAEKRVLLRLVNTEEIVPPPKLPQIKAPIPDVSEAVLVDQHGLLFSLRSDFNALVEYAKAYHTKVSKHVALDMQYLEWLPHLYSNKPTSVTLSVPCRALINPLHSCKGPAALSTIYEGIKEDTIIRRKVDENRAEYKQLLIEALMPPSQHVCSAAVHIEHTMRALATLTHTCKTPQLRDTLHDIGVTLFYHMTTFISDDTKFYPPTKQFFTSCIEELGQEFVRGNPNQAQPLMQAILQNSSLLCVLSPNFTPTSNPELFLNMYRDMTAVPVQHGSEVAFTMLSKFDVHQWLQTYAPPLTQRASLVQLVTAALTTCGPSPKAPHHMVFEVYRTHLVNLLCYNFPEVYNDVLNFLLKCSSGGRLSALLWEDFVTCLGCVAETTENRRPLDAATRLTDQPLVQQLSLNQLEESIRSLHSCLTSERTGTESGIQFGLYPTWKEYAGSLTVYTHSLLAACTDIVVCDLQNHVVEYSVALQKLWQLTLAAYGPWLVVEEKRGTLLQPWIAADAEVASRMLDHWIKTVTYLHHKLTDLSREGDIQVMNFTCQLYAQKVAPRGVQEHVTSLMHTHLTQAPWAEFLPNLYDIQSLNKVLEVNEGHCADFMCYVVCQIRWKNVLRYVMDPNHSGFENTTVYHAQLFHLLVRLGAHSFLLQEDTGLVGLLATAEDFAWDVFLEGSSFQLGAESYCHACDVSCVLAERSAPGAAVLRLLKKASGFYHSSEPLDHPELALKRILYVRCVVQLLCKSTRTKPPEGNTGGRQKEALAIALSNLLTQVETVVSTVKDSAEQDSTAIGLCKEVLNILNNCNPQGKVSQHLLEVILQWVRDSQSSPLLYSLLNATCLNLASLPFMLSITEECMDAHFACFPGEMSSRRDGGWDCLLSNLHVPELNQSKFLQLAVSGGSFLTLFACVLQRLPLSQCIQDEYTYFANLVNWTAQARPTADNEYKLFLWWTRIIELSLRQADLGEAISDVRQKLQSFTSALWTLGEDKASAGLLGSIGLGRRSQLSQRFRVICKCLAAYICAQLPQNLNRPRLTSQDPGHLQDSTSPRGPAGPTVTASSQARQYHAHIEAMKQNKDYAGHKEDIEYYLDYVSNRGRTLREAHALLVKLVSTLYPEQACLVILKS